MISFLKKEKKTHYIEKDYYKSFRTNIYFTQKINNHDPYPYKYIELLKPCPLPFGIVCGIMREKFFEAGGGKQISPA